MLSNSEKAMVWGGMLSNINTCFYRIWKNFIYTVGKFYR